MKTEKVKLSQVKVNAENPRTITSEKFQKLVNSLLVFPKMLEIRPIVVDDRMCAIGGNMRTNALKAIAKMSITDIADRLSTVSDFVEKTEGERKLLVEHWHKWLDNPTATVINASELSAEERQQFIIKDNASFGQWDYDALANKWDGAKLGDWGLDVWNMKPTDFSPTGVSAGLPSQPQSLPDPSEEDNPIAQFQGSLPPELQGIDFNPDNLPKIQGDDVTAMERIIIVYTKDRLPDLQQLLGMPSIDKVVYKLEEILPQAESEQCAG